MNKPNLSIYYLKKMRALLYKKSLDSSVTDQDNIFIDFSYFDLVYFIISNLLILFCLTGNSI